MIKFLQYMAIVTHCRIISIFEICIATSFAIYWEILIHVFDTLLKA